MDYAPKIPAIGGWSTAFEQALKHPSQAPAKPSPPLHTQFPVKEPAHAQRDHVPVPELPATKPPYKRAISQAEVSLWNTIHNSSKPSDFWAYLQQYPNGVFAPLARNIMASLAKLQKVDGPELYAQGEKLYKKSDFSGAAFDYQEACDVQYARACFDLAIMYGTTGVTLNNSESARLAQRACDGGIAPGCVLAGDAYESGNGVTINPDTAAQFYQKACSLGYQTACGK